MTGGRVCDKNVGTECLARTILAVVLLPFVFQCMDEAGGVEDDGWMDAAVQSSLAQFSSSTRLD